MNNTVFFLNMEILPVGTQPQHLSKISSALMYSGVERCLSS